MPLGLSWPPKHCAKLMNLSLRIQCPYSHHSLSHFSHLSKQRVKLICLQHIRARAHTHTHTHAHTYTQNRTVLASRCPLTLPLLLPPGTHNLQVTTIMATVDSIWSSGEGVSLLSFLTPPTSPPRGECESPVLFNNNDMPLSASTLLLPQDDFCFDKLSVTLSRALTPPPEVTMIASSTFTLPSSSYHPDCETCMRENQHQHYHHHHHAGSTLSPSHNGDDGFLLSSPSPFHSDPHSLACSCTCCHHHQSSGLSHYMPHNGDILALSDMASHSEDGDAVLSPPPSLSAPDLHGCGNSCSCTSCAGTGVFGFPSPFHGNGSCHGLAGSSMTSAGSSMTSAGSCSSVSSVESESSSSLSSASCSSCSSCSCTSAPLLPCMSPSPYSASNNSSRYSSRYSSFSASSPSNGGVARRGKGGTTLKATATSASGKRNGAVTSAAGRRQVHQHLAHTHSHPQRFSSSASTLTACTGACCAPSSSSTTTASSRSSSSSSSVYGHLHGHTHGSNGQLSGAAKRESHNQSERHRRLAMKSSFDTLRSLIPEVSANDRVHTGHILKAAIAFIQELQRQENDLVHQKEVLREALQKRKSAIMVV
eukprot:m.281348 g.281348  ORF g.281348 m.281348 type:complete len:592 (-) comp15751_c6_seq16:1254-3029(-)